MLATITKLLSNAPRNRNVAVGLRKSSTFFDVKNSRASKDARVRRDKIDVVFETASLSPVARLGDK